MSLSESLQTRLILVALACALTSPPADAAEDGERWGQWRGPDRDGVASQFDAPEEWPRELAAAWRIEVGDGHSSPLVDGEEIYLFVRTASGEALEARSLASGELLWSVGYEQEYEPISVAASHGKGPFSTPVLAGGTIVTLGINGVLTAWSREDGARIWQVRSEDLFGKPRPFYGHASSPLVVGDRVYAYLGGPGEGALLAFSLADGSEVWRRAGDGPAYGSPTVIEAHGERQIVTLSQRRFLGVRLEDGELLWELPFQVTFDSGSIRDLLVISAGKVPLQAYRLVEREGSMLPVEAWRNDAVHLGMSSPVPAGDRLWAFSEKKSGQLVAVSLANGEVVWEGPARKGDSAFLTLAGDRLMNVYSSGEMEVFDVAADEPVLLGTYRLTEDHEVWAHPAFVGDSIVIKARTELARFRVRP